MILKQFQELEDRLRTAGFPTEGQDAEELWRTLSGNHAVDAVNAARLYRSLGYQPFAGYPLTRLETNGHHETR